MGWSIGGLSTISRCPKTIATDGVPGGVNYDSEDRFCLGGQRLIAISGTYGAHATHYRTEIDGLSRVVSTGTSGDGPTRFKVWTRDGRTLQYGYNQDSRIQAEGQSVVRVWALDRVTDRAGNYMTYTYVEDGANGEYYIDEINYTLNDGASATGTNKIQFRYGGRTDDIVLYRGGSKIQVSKRLTQVRIRVDGTRERTYYLRYEYGGATGRSRLTEVEDCEGDGSGDCLEPIKFTWKAESAGFATVSDGGVAGAAMNFYEPLNPQQHDNPATDYVYYRRGELLDLNGDGLTDYIYAYKDGGIYKGTYLRTATGWQLKANYAHPSFIHDSTSSAIGDTGNFNRNNRRTGDFADVTGDGLPDWIGGDGPDTSGSASAVHVNTGSAFQLDSGLELPSRITNSADGESYGILIDVNGDGLVDFVKAYSGGTKKTWLNTGSGWQVNTGYKAPYDIYNGTGQRSFFADVNGDGLPDFMRAKFGSTAAKTWLNTGSGWSAEANFKAPHDNTQPSNETLIDINGDGLTDIIASASGVKDVWLSTGDGWIKDTSYELPENRKSGSQIVSRFVDVNGDGLPDFVKAGNSTTPKTWLNTGKGWNLDSSYQFPTIFSQSVALPGPQTVLVEMGEFADLNGDGVADWVASSTGLPGGGGSGAWLAKSEAPDHLITVEDSLGAVTDIVYKSLTDDTIYEKKSNAAYPINDVQPPMWVVSKLKREDGIGGQYKTNYAYGGMKIDIERAYGSLGFEYINMEDEETGILTDIEYDQDFPWIGQAFKEERYLDNGTMLSALENDWARLKFDSHPNSSATTYFPYIKNSYLDNYELNDGANNDPITEVHRHFVYDDYGNVTTDTTTTNVFGSTNEYETKFINSYVAPNTSTWTINLLSETKERRTLPTSTTFVERVTEFDYDADGLLEKTTVEPSEDEELITEFDRDAFGNVTETDLHVKETPTSPVVHRITTMAYDADGLFPITETNALNQVTAREFDPRHGTITKETDPNLVEVEWTYDAFGRMTREDRPDGTYTDISYLLCGSEITCQSAGVYAVRQEFERAGVQYQSDQTDYYDVLNRVFRSTKKGFGGTAIYVQTTYNDRGLVSAVTRPYFNGDTPETTTSTYDILGRTLVTTAPDGGTTSVAYDGLTTVTTNALNKDETRITDAIGQLDKVKDHSDNRIRYFYDEFGNLITVWDTQNDVTNLTYDNLGRKLTIDDPNMGAWSYAYNNVGELVSQTDAKNQTVTMAYDVLGRITSRVEAEGTTTWTYDHSPNGAGKLRKVVDYNGNQAVYIYDTKGRLTKTNYTIDGDTFGEDPVFDNTSRLSKLIYPTGFAVDYSYNSRGYLVDVIRSADSSLVYQVNDMNAEDQITEEEFGSGLITQRTYDPETSLVTAIQTFDGANPTVQDMAFTFDEIGNLTKRQDFIEDRREVFTYDNRNRLTNTALRIDSTVTTLGSTNYSYNPAGNLVTKSDIGSLSYGQNGYGPHAVTTANGNTYDYDANGSLEFVKVSGTTTRTIAWSSFNKPTSMLNANGEGSLFVYGHDRKRVKQTTKQIGVADRITRYAGQFYELQEQAGQDDEQVHYIYAGEGRVAIQKIKVDSGGTTTATQKRYLHKDHLGSITEVTSGTGAVLESLSYDAHGKRRETDWDAASSPIFANQTLRGFTDHEHLDVLGLIHMNGRVYDPTLGRFLSADPFIQFPETTQGFNRYAYVNNNPLSFTDSSGFRVDDGNTPNEGQGTALGGSGQGSLAEPGKVPAHDVIARNTPSLFDINQTKSRIIRAGKFSNLSQFEQDLAGLMEDSTFDQHLGSLAGELPETSLQERLAAYREGLGSISLGVQRAAKHIGRLLDDDPLAREEAQAALDVVEAFAQGLIEDPEFRALALEVTLVAVVRNRHRLAGRLTVTAGVQGFFTAVTNRTAIGFISKFGVGGLATFGDMMEAAHRGFKGIDIGVAGVLGADVLGLSPPSN